MLACRYVRQTREGGALEGDKGRYSSGVISKTPVDSCVSPGSEAGGSKAKPVKRTDAEAVIEKHMERAKRAREQEDKWLGVQNNMAVYVTGLPDDTSEAELAQVDLILALSHHL